MVSDQLLKPDMTSADEKIGRGELVEIDPGISAMSGARSKWAWTGLGVCLRYRELTLCADVQPSSAKTHGGYDIYIDGHELWYPERAVTRV
jgi:hypothetical protein